MGLNYVATLLRAPPSASATPVNTGERPAAAAVTLLSILGKAEFWWLVMFAGLLQASGIVSFTYIVANAISLGNPLPRASLLLSVLGITSMVGAFGFGWLADRIGPLHALIIGAAAQTLLWLGIAVVPGFSALTILAGCLGLCTGGTTPAVFAFIAHRWGHERFSSVQGQMTLMMIPFIFGMPPLIGWLFDRAGNYRFAFTVEAAACGLALLLLVGGYRLRIRRPLTKLPHAVRVGVQRCGSTLSISRSNAAFHLVQRNLTLLPPFSSRPDGRHRFTGSPEVGAF